MVAGNQPSLRCRTPGSPLDDEQTSEGFDASSSFDNGREDSNVNLERDLGYGRPG